VSAGPVDVDEFLQVDFACGCHVHVTREWQISLWSCSEGCPNWLLIQLDLERCLRQLRIGALGRGILPATGAGQGTGGSL
jgi:hypothetical protein